MSEILVKEYRGNIVENAHRGSIAVVSSTGDTIAYLGDIEKQTFMRSASKPIQVLPTLLAGLHRRFNLTDEDVAMFNSSHWGSNHHIFVLEEKIRANVNYVNTLLNEMGMIFDRTTTLDSGFGFTTDDATGTAITDTTDHYLMANVSIDNLALLANRVMDYEVLDVETLNGVHSLGSDEHIHFDLYENEALNWTLKTFYTEADGN